jgi:hypothetical protein
VLSENPNRTGRRGYFGRVDPQGNYHPSRYVTAEVTASIVARLHLFAENPAQVASEYGRLHGRCCFCRLPLTDARSTAVGYGAICAGHYGLPWGERPTEFAAPVASTGGVVERQRATISRAMAPRTIELRGDRDGYQRTPPPQGQQPFLPLPQLDLNFDAAAEHARRASSGQECPACESSSISSISTTQGNQWHCHACGVNWNKPEANQ